jgi:hypothetical protein
MKVSADRILYLSRVITRKLKDNMNLVQKADDETVRRAVVRVLTDAYKELDQIEDKVQASIAKRKVPAKDQEYQYNRAVEDELKKHGV